MSNKQFNIASNLIPLIGALILFSFSLFRGLFNKEYTTGFWIVIIIDFYLLYVLVYAGLKSDFRWSEKWWMGILIPSRTAGIFIFIFLYASVVNGFGAMFMELNAPKYTTINAGAYQSFIGLSAFNYEDYSKLGENLWRLQMWQTGNGLLLLTAAFGFLVSRLSTFREKHTIEKIYSDFKNAPFVAESTDTVRTLKEEIETLNDQKKELEIEIGELMVKKTP